jgi:hypothetical protein
MNMLGLIPGDEVAFLQVVELAGQRIMEMKRLAKARNFGVMKPKNNTTGNVDEATTIQQNAMLILPKTETVLRSPQSAHKIIEKESMMMKEVKPRRKQKWNLYKLSRNNNKKTNVGNGHRFRGGFGKTVGQNPAERASIGRV